MLSLKDFKYFEIQKVKHGLIQGGAEETYKDTYSDSFEPMDVGDCYDETTVTKTDSGVFVEKCVHWTCDWENSNTC